MSLLRLDYQRKSNPLPRLGLAVLGLALAALITIGVQYAWLLDGTGQFESRARALKLRSPEAAPAGSQRGDKGAAALALEIRQANQVLRQLSVPWDALFEAVEAAGDKDVTLISMEPDVEKQGARIIGEAKNIAAVLNYMRQLGKQPVLHDITLQHHQIQSQDSEKPVRFTVVASWEIES